MEFHYSHNGQDYTIRLEPLPDGTIRAVLGDRVFVVEVQREPEGQFNLQIDGHRVHAYTAATRTRQMRTELRYVALVDRETCFFELEKITGAGRRIRHGKAASGTLLAQMPGQIMRVALDEGAAVEEGDLILLLEAMKMEIRVTAPLTGILTRLHVSSGDQVERSQPLAVVEPASDD